MQVKTNFPVQSDEGTQQRWPGNSSRHVLVADADVELRRRMREVLNDRTYNVHETDNCDDASCFGATGRYDAVILDVALDGRSALALLERWRAEGLSTPVVLIDADGTWHDRVLGLRAGADDYLTKPFQAEEMIARLEAIWRRVTGWTAQAVAFGELVLDLVGRSARYRGAEVNLTALEFKVLRHLVENRGRTVSSSELLEHAYGAGADLASNAIEVTISRIRGKLDRNLIRTRRGQGYSIDL